MSPPDLDPPLDVHELAAVHILGLNLFCACRMAFVRESPAEALLRWERLPHADQLYWVEQATIWLTSRRKPIVVRTGDDEAA